MYLFILQIVYYILVVAFLIPLFIMTFAYTSVGISLYKSVKEARAMSRLDSLAYFTPFKPVKFF